MSSSRMWELEYTLAVTCLGGTFARDGPRMDALCLAPSDRSKTAHCSSVALRNLIVVTTSVSFKIRTADRPSITSTFT